MSQHLAQVLTPTKTELKGKSLKKELGKIITDQQEPLKKLFPISSKIFELLPWLKTESYWSQTTKKYSCTEIFGFQLQHSSCKPNENTNKRQIHQAKSNPVETLNYSNIAAVWQSHTKIYNKTKSNSHYLPYNYHSHTLFIQTDIIRFFWHVLY